MACILFCIGKELEKQAELAVKALLMGFMLGNHAYSHHAFSNLTLRTAYKGIEKTHMLLDKIHKMAGMACYTSEIINKIKKQFILKIVCCGLLY